MHIIYLMFKESHHLERAWTATAIVMAIYPLTATMTVSTEQMTIALALIAFATALMTNIFGYIKTRSETRAEAAKTRTEVAKVGEQLGVVHGAINSGLEKIIAELKEKYLAEGKLAGVEEATTKRDLEDLNKAKGEIKGVATERQKEADLKSTPQ